MPLFLAPIIAFLESLGIANLVGWATIRAAILRLGTWASANLSRQVIVGAVSGLVFKILDLIERDETVRSAVSSWLFDRTGLEVNEFTPEGMKDAAGRLLAKKINEKFGTSIENMYPVDVGIDAVLHVFITELINVINKKTKATDLHFVTKETGLIYVNQIMNAYKGAYGYTTMGNGVIQTITPARAKNKQRQAKWRIGKPRVSVWKTEESKKLVEAFEAKIKTLHEKKKAWKAAVAEQNKYIRQQRYWFKKGNAVKATQYQNLANGMAAIIAQKLLDFQNAQKV